ncbi:hypothetical protein SAMN05421748_10274 [Paractinoplanes atraurantiacus]|uniref:Uncharacterized protein n=1 Tax=Paractinoplanes atraurantiacus TaxID=1036182 RepID=A0A285GMC0_9ACTN|nr:hypothetical protein SAMN05421748_10274 [Actinoplanes atraurantiacus]
MTINPVPTRPLVNVLASFDPPRAGPHSSAS